jgi:hypothetical protein
MPRLDLALAGACATFLTAWVWIASGTMSAATAAIAAAMFAVYYAAGTLLCGVRPLSALTDSFPLRILVGYFVSNTALFVIAWVNPRLLGAAFPALVVASAVAFVRGVPRAERRPGQTPAVFATLLSLVAATLWAQDCLWPLQQSGDVTVFRPWVDSFFHAAQIASVSGIHGSARVEDIYLAAAPARLYHYAPYVSPAIVELFSPASAYAAYGAVLVPLGFFMTGVAGFVMASCWWGPWSGFMGAAALLLLPDASLHGTRNSYLAYHWMQAVGPAGLYGVALLGLAWTLMIRGCERRDWTLVVGSWCCSAVVLCYKAQFFVAAAFLLWVVPPIAMRGLRPLRRLGWFVVAAGLYAGAVTLSNESASLPLIRLDGSAAGEFLGGLLMANTAPGPFRDFFAPHLGTGRLLETAAFGIPFLLFSAVGILAFMYGALAITLRSRVNRIVLLFPAAIIANFLVMGTFLAYDSRGVGTKEELLHRPFVWAYFVTVVWVGGAAAVLIEPWLRKRAISSCVLAATVAPLLGVPAWRGALGTQSKSGWSLANVPVPSELVAAAAYVRGHSSAAEVFQDFRLDRYSVFTALSERRPYVATNWNPTSYGASERAARISVVSSVAEIRDSQVLEAAARQLGLRWVLLWPESTVRWPASVVNNPSYSSGRLRLYRLY